MQKAMSYTFDRILKMPLSLMFTFVCVQPFILSFVCLLWKWEKKDCKLRIFQLKNNHIAPSNKIYIKNKNKTKTMWWRTCLNTGKLRWNVSNISAVMQLNIIAHIAQLHKKKKSYLAISTETEVLLIIAS